MGGLKFLNGARRLGARTNQNRPQYAKRTLAGAVSMTAAPNTKTTITGVGATGATTKSPTLGLTGNIGGRNFVSGKVIVVNTAAAKHTCYVKAKTIGGTTTVKKTTVTTTTVSKTFKNTTAAPIDVPGTLVVKVVPAAGKVTTIKLGTVSVNGLTTMMS